VQFDGNAAHPHRLRPHGHGRAQQPDHEETGADEHLVRCGQQAEEAECRTGLCERQRAVPAVPGHRGPDHLAGRQRRQQQTQGGRAAGEVVFRQPRRGHEQHALGDVERHERDGRGDDDAVAAQSG
jgi:hypothetical protein